MIFGTIYKFAVNDICGSVTGKIIQIDHGFMLLELINDGGRIFYNLDKIICFMEVK